MNNIELLKTTHYDDHNYEAPLAKARPKVKWPEPLEPAAFHGVAGEIIKAIEPHTESDINALLIQFFTIFGNVIGRTSYFPVEADRQHLNLFSVIVGNSSKARKGTGLGHIKRLFQDVEPDYMKSRVISGLSSGEGLIASVRDQKTVESRDEETGRIHTKVVDEGVTDKRALCIETEFASVLQALRREGNKLSAIIRDCYDHGNLSILTKNDPIKATDSHISVIGHITQPELKRYLNDVELLNGFANRFIWVASKRSKILPLGGNFNHSSIESQLLTLRRAIDFGRRTAKLSFSKDGYVLWCEIYRKYAEERPGLYGSLIARAEATLIRVSSIYALLDQSSEVKPEHLKAALAVWEYVERSIRFIFGNHTGNKHADKILRALIAEENGLTQTEIYKDVFSKNLNKEFIGEALTLLKEEGLATDAVEDSEGGRKRIRWRCTQSH